VFFIYLFLFIYLFFMIWLLDGYNYLVKEINYDDEELPFVSIVIAIKNEENNILELVTSLINQSYPKKLYEIIKDKGNTKIKISINANKKNYLFELKDRRKFDFEILKHLNKEHYIKKISV